MTRLIAATLILASLSLAALPTVPAPPSPLTVSLAAGNNWSAVVFTSPVDCTSARLHAGWETGSPAASALVYVFGGTTVNNYAMYWEEGNNVWISADPGNVFLGQRATTDPGYENDIFGAAGFDLSPVLCSGTLTFTRIALIVPYATTARVDLVLANAPAITATLGGSDALGLFGRDFEPVTGAKVDVGTFGTGAGDNPGANAVVDSAATRTLGEGLLGVFRVAQIEVGGLRVTSPDGIVMDSDCVTVFLAATCFSFGSVNGITFGDDSDAPAGDYEFAIRYQAGPEHHRVAMVGAPVDWCDVGPACPDMGIFAA